MTYSSGSLILDDDYNIFATGNAAGTGDNNVANVNTVWGAGTGNKGYGQSTTITPVAAPAVITATQWSTLLARITSAANHQGTSITSITNPVVGDTISAYAALSNNVTAIFNGRNNAAANGTDITTNGTTSTTSAWYTSASISQTVTFSSADAARYYFNAGGMIRLAWSRSGGTVSTRNSEWTDLLTQSGTIATTCGASVTQTIAGTSYTGTTKVGGAGTPNILLTTTGFYSLTPGGAATTIFKQYADTSPYTGSYIQLNISLNASSTVLTFATSLVDTGGYTDPADGTLSQVMTVRPPSTSYLTNTWGTPAMSATSWSVA